MQTGKMRIYGAGGAGINIAHHFEGASNKPDALSAEIVVSYIDTSLSNIPAGVDEKRTFLLDADGSGKVRKQNYEKIMDVVKQIILDHKPGDFNVVVFSASGGSGSVIGPLICQELLSKGIPVVAVVVGSDESTIAAQNSMKTLKSLEGISSKVGMPLVMHYRHNRRGKPRTEVDADLFDMINLLSILASRKIKEVDGQDVRNLLFYQNVTSVQPRLAALEVTFGDDPIPEPCRPHSVLSVYRDCNVKTLEYVPDYHCAGYANLPDDTDSIHFMVDVEAIQAYVSELNKTISQMEEVQASRTNHKSIVSKDETDDSGMVM